VNVLEFSADAARNWRHRLRRWWNKPRGQGFSAATWMEENKALFPRAEAGEIGDGNLHRADHVL